MTMDADQERARFDRWAPRYDRSLLQALLFSPTHAAVVTAAIEAGSHPRSVLDLGCGTGRLLERAAQQWPDAALIGIDASPRMIAEARVKLSGDARFRFEVADAAALPLEPASVDLAFSTVSFHHWADQAGGVREVARVLGAGGLFVLADLAPPLLRGSLANRVHGVRSRRKLFEQAGLSVVRQWRPTRLAGHVLITVGRKG
jgi:ubiquinone/menaquinone biosynthesis C-methylase UbiE